MYISDNKENKVLKSGPQISFRIEETLKNAFVGAVKGRGDDVTAVLTNFARAYTSKNQAALSIAAGEEPVIAKTADVLPFRAVREVEPDLRPLLDEVIALLFDEPEDRDHLKLSNILKAILEHVPARDPRIKEAKINSEKY